MFTLVVFILFYVPANDSHKADKPVNAAGPIVAQPSGIRSMPVVKAILGDAPSAEWEVVKRYVLRNSLNPDAIQFEKWFPSRDASPNDSNAFEVEKRYDPVVWNKLMEMNLQKRELEKPARYPGYFFGREDYLAQRAKLSEEERKEWDEYERKRDEFESTHKNLLSKQFVERKLMTADRVVRVITRTNAPILGTIRTDDFYYLKDGKVVKCQSGTPADQDKLIAIYYPGED